MKTNIFFHAACIMIIILAVTLINFFIKPKIPLENNLCKSTVSYRLDDSSHNFEYNIFTNLNFTNTGKGYEHMRGVVIKNGTKYTLARNINFSYQVRNNNNYEITVSDVNKLGQDNIPENLISQYFAYTLPNSFTVIKVNEIGNNLILVSGLQGPVFICSLL